MKIRMRTILTNPLLLSCFIGLIILLQSGCHSEEGNKPSSQNIVTVAPEEQNVPDPNESAFETVLRKLKKNPDNIKAIYHLADLYYRNGKYEEAIENYNKVISREPDRGYVYFRLGTSYNRLQRYEEALEAFKKAIPNLPSPAMVYNNMGITYGKLGQYQEEIDALQNAIKHRSRYAAARYNLGVTYLKVGDIQGALEQYEALNEFDLTMAEALKKEIDEKVPQPNPEMNEQ